MAEQAKTDTPAPPAKGGPGILGLLLPALLAGAAAFGGAKIAGARAAAPAAAVNAHAAAKPPGPTLALEPFLVNTSDANKKMHPMKVTLAIEFDEHVKEETLKPFIPRIRDASLSYFRSITFEEATDTTHSEKLRADLLERYRTSGANGAERVLITDLVVQ